MLGLQIKIMVQPQKAKLLRVQVLVLLLTHQHYAPLLHGPKFKLLPAVRINILCRRYRPVISDRLARSPKTPSAAMCSMVRREKLADPSRIASMAVCCINCSVETQCTICHGQSALSSTYSSSSVSSSSAQVLHKPLALQCMDCSACLHLASWTHRGHQAPEFISASRSI